MARYPHAQWRGPVPNEGGAMGPVRLGVVHIMEGTLAGTDSWFNDPAAQVSAHFGIGKDGTVYQWVDTDRVAWAEVAYNDQAISVEHEGHSGDTLTLSQLFSLAALVAWVGATHGVPIMRTSSIGPGWLGHGELGIPGGNHPDCPGAPILGQLPQVLALAAAGVSPAPNPQPQGEPKMFASDPVTGGVWATDPDGALYALLGAPYVAGLNTHPGWQAGEAESAGANPCVGLAYWREAGVDDGVIFFTKPASGEGGIAGTPYSGYRFRRDGTPD